MGTTVGYARVSTVGQSLEVQLDKLQPHCDRIYKEKRSGMDGKRPELAKCLEYLREGDTLVITKLDRLARSTLHLGQIVKDLDDKDINFRVLDQAIDTATPQGKLMFHVLAAVAEFEHGIRAERQAEGIQKAKESGTQFGRKSTITDQQRADIRAKRTSGVLIKDLKRQYGLSKSSIYRILASQQ